MGYCLWNENLVPWSRSGFSTHSNGTLKWTPWNAGGRAPNAFGGTGFGLISLGLVQIQDSYLDSLSHFNNFIWGLGCSVEASTFVVMQIVVLAYLEMRVLSN